MRRLELLDWIAADFPGLGSSVDLVWVKGAGILPIFLPSRLTWDLLESDMGNLDDVVAATFDPPMEGSLEVAGNLEAFGSLVVAEGNLEDDGNFNLM